MLGMTARRASQDATDKDKVVASHCCIDDEDWINPFAIKSNDEALSDVGLVAIVNFYTLITRAELISNILLYRFHDTYIENKFQI